MLEAAIAAADTRASSKLHKYFPDEGPYRRELYPKHLQFFRAGKTHRTRAFVAGNRVGKSDTGAYEVAHHLTGDYPPWWEGRRFDVPTFIWAAGDTTPRRPSGTSCRRSSWAHRGRQGLG